MSEVIMMSHMRLVAETMTAEVLSVRSAAQRGSAPSARASRMTPSMSSSANGSIVRWRKVSFQEMSPASASQ